MKRSGGSGKRIGGRPKNGVQRTSPSANATNPGGRRRRRLLEATTFGPDVSAILDTVVKNLRAINQLGQEQSPNNITTATTTMAINTWAQGFGNVGMLSYPNFKDDCRKLSYPNLDLLYQACDMAQVDCEHVYIYRDPYAVLRSTGRRDMNPTMLAAIHLYISHLHIIFAQLATHPQRTAGCWGVLEEEEEEEVNSTATDEMWTSIQSMFGWEDRQAFQKDIFEGLYKAPTVLTDEEKKALVPPKFDPYLQSLYRAHQNAIGLCRQQVAANKNNLI
jgi:hypothetical protein